MKLSWNGKKKKESKKPEQNKGMKEKLSILIFIDIDPKTGKIYLFACYFSIQGIKEKKSMNRGKTRHRKNVKVVFTEKTPNPKQTPF